MELCDDKIEKHKLNQVCAFLCIKKFLNKYYRISFFFQLVIEHVFSQTKSGLCNTGVHVYNLLKINKYVLSLNYFQSKMGFFKTSALLKTCF